MLVHPAVEHPPPALQAGFLLRIVGTILAKIASLVWGNQVDTFSALRFGNAVEGNAPCTINPPAGNYLVEQLQSQARSRPS